MLSTWFWNQVGTILLCFQGFSKSSGSTLVQLGQSPHCYLKILLCQHLYFYINILSWSGLKGPVPLPTSSVFSLIFPHLLSYVPHIAKDLQFPENIYLWAFPLAFLFTLSFLNWSGTSSINTSFILPFRPNINLPLSCHCIPCILLLQPLLHSIAMFWSYVCLIALLDCELPSQNSFHWFQNKVPDL